MDAVNIGVSLFMMVSQVVAIVLGALALGGGTWIEGVENRGDYFTRIQSSDNSHSYMSDGDLHSMGMWRYFTKPGESNPLPIRDPELTAGTVCYVIALTMAGVSIVILSYQILGIKSRSVAVSLAIFWACFVEFAFLLIANTVVLHYFKNTFEYDRLGHSHHVCWISFSFASLTAIVAILKVYLTSSSASDEADGTNAGSGRYQNGRPYSPRSLSGIAPPPSGPSTLHHQGGGTGGYYPPPQHKQEFSRYSDYDLREMREMRPQPPKNYVPSNDYPA